MNYSRASGVGIALALGLCVAATANSAAAADGGETVTIVETAAAKAPDPDSPGLHIFKGRAYGVLDKQPLDEVLEAYARATGMAYEVDEPLGSHPISGRLDGLPAGEALVDLLRHFDYTAVWRADGMIERLKVTSLRSAYRQVAGGAASASGAASAAPRVQSAARRVGEEIRQEETLEANLTEEEPIEDASFEASLMDLFAFAMKVGIPEEDLYLVSPGSGRETEYNLVLIAELVRQMEDEKTQEQ